MVHVYELRICHDEWFVCDDEEVLVFEECCDFHLNEYGEPVGD